MKHVEERTQLAGANRFEILLFSLGKDQRSGREEVFGINVFKVREVIRAPEIVRAPDMPESVEGIVSLRGTIVPVVNLARFCGLNVAEPPRIMLVTEFDRSVQGFLVHSVENIVRLDWSQVKAPPAMLSNRLHGLVTAVTELGDGRIALIMDVERVLAETANAGKDASEFEGVEPLQTQATVFFADDSPVARKRIESTLDRMGIKHIGAANGREAWEKLQELAERAREENVPLNSIIQVVLTDIEMPEMDGYVLTKNIKSDPRFQGIPVIMHSSLSGGANVVLGKGVGADGYVPKFDAQELSVAIRGALEKQSG